MKYNFFLIMSFFCSYAFCMELSDCTKVLPKDIIRHIFSFSDVVSAASFLRTCKDIYTIYSDDSHNNHNISAMLPIDLFFLHNKSKRDINLFVHYAQSGNEKMMKFFINDVSNEEKRKIFDILSFFKYTEEDYNDISSYMCAYRGIRKGCAQLDLNDACYIIKNTIQTDFDCLYILLKNGINVNATYWSRIACNRVPALSLAAKYNLLDCVSLLIKKGANIHFRYHCCDEFAIFHYALNHVDVMRLLLQAGVDINVQTGKGETALYLAVKEGNVESVRFLLEQGAEDLCMQGMEFQTAYDLAGDRMLHGNNKKCYEQILQLFDIAKKK